MAEVQFQFVYPTTCPGGHTAQLAFRPDVNMDNGFGIWILGYKRSETHTFSV